MEVAPSSEYSAKKISFKSTAEVISLLNWFLVSVFYCTIIKVDTKANKRLLSILLVWLIDLSNCTVEKVMLDSVWDKIAWFVWFLYYRVFESRNLIWGSVNSHISYRDSYRREIGDYSFIKGNQQSNQRF